MSKIQNVKKSLQTILDQLPQFIVKYEPSERVMIEEFLAVIDRFEEADNKRGILISRFNKYSENVLKTKEYKPTPFLWYTESVADQAIINLSISRFHALDFYKFLLYQLRELYQLMKKGTKLSSDKYDTLQSKCEKADFTLTSDEFEILKTTYSSIKNDKIDSLRSKYIKRKIIDNVAISDKYKRITEISRFYTLVGGKWWLQFHSTKFGLNRVFFHIQLAKNVDLKQIIDFNDLDNTVLGISNVYQVLKTKGEYMGTLLVPNHDINILHDYLKQCEHKNYIKLKEFAIIVERRRNTSLTSYKPDKGWQDLPAKKQNTIIKDLKAIKVEARNSDGLTIPKQWSFIEYPYPLDIIRLYCKLPEHFSYSKLPLDRIKGEEGTKLSMAEMGLVRYLINKEAIEVGFTPWRLIYNYSVNDYFIRVPKLPLKKLAHFLNIIPFSEIYFSNYYTYIWTRLPEKSVTMIKNDLKWIILPVLRTHMIKDLDFNWFDRTSLEWSRPKVLRK